MMYSLEEEIFGRNLSIIESLIVSYDIKTIRWNYFKKKKFKNITKMTRSRILKAFQEWDNGSVWQYCKRTMPEWYDFVNIVNQESPEFLEGCMWL